MPTNRSRYFDCYELNHVNCDLNAVTQFFLLPSFSSVFLVTTFIPSSGSLTCNRRTSTQPSLYIFVFCFSILFCAFVCRLNRGVFFSLHVHVGFWFIGGTCTKAFPLKYRVSRHWRQVSLYVAGPKATWQTACTYLRDSKNFRPLVRRE